MQTEPEIKILSYQRRERFFWILVVVFLVALPSLIFYTTGHRLSFETQEIVTTGGVYVTTDNLEVDVYLDEDQVERPRLFRQAYYIQNISAGQHRVVVQRPDLQTWVKDLPVYPGLVSEVSAFNMPIEPHLRPIAEFETSTGTPVLFVSSSTEDVFERGTSTVPFLVATSSATTTYALNQEFVFVESLFSTTSTSTESVFERIMDQVERFGFATTTPTATTSATATEPIIRGDMELVDRDGQLYAQWLGEDRTIPFYFCVSSSTETTASTTGERYGEHVELAIAEYETSTSTPLIFDSNRICRTEIQLDRLRKDVYYYDFFPNSSDLVLLHLDDGIYVTEIDDRAWQNTQLLYPGSNIRVVVENDVIYLEEDGRYFEIITEIEPAE